MSDVQSTLGVTSNLGPALAGNFSVTGPGWNVESLDFYGCQTGALGFTFTNVTWSMRSGADVSSAAIVASGTTAVTSDEQPLRRHPGQRGARAGHLGVDAGRRRGRGAHGARSPGLTAHDSETT